MDSYRGDGLNLYAYVANNPINYIDPTGYCKEDAYNQMENIVIAQYMTLFIDEQINDYYLQDSADYPMLNQKKEILRNFMKENQNELYNNKVIINNKDAYNIVSNAIKSDKILSIQEISKIKKSYSKNSDIGKYFAEQDEKNLKEYKAETEKLLKGTAVGATLVYVGFVALPEVVGMSQGTANVAENVGDDVVEGAGNLAKGKVDHVLKDHTYGRMQNTINKMMDKGLNENAQKLLNKKSFFNPNWSEQKVINATNQAYNKTLSQGITNGNYTVKVFGENITVNMENGVFRSAYGNYKFTLSDFGF